MAAYFRRFAVFLLLLSTTTTSVAVEELNTEGLLQRHLDSIGSAEARANVKSRVVEGTATYRVLVGGSGEIGGKCIMVSEKIKAAGFVQNKCTQVPWREIRSERRQDLRSRHL